MNKDHSLRNAKLEQLRAALRQGLESLDSRNGRPLDIEAIKVEGRKRKAAAKTQRKRDENC
jgi:hypothetical protein